MRLLCELFDVFLSVLEGVCCGVFCCGVVFVVVCGMGFLVGCVLGLVGVGFLLGSVLMGVLVVGFCMMIVGLCVFGCSVLLWEVVFLFVVRDVLYLG